MSYSVYMETFVLVFSSCAYLWLFTKACQKQKREGFRTLCTILLTIATAALLVLALLARKDDRTRSLDLIPFSTYYRILTNYACFDVFKQIIDNILIFVPFGFLIPEAAGLEPSKRSLAIVCLTGAGFSLFIEASQYAFSLGFSEMDDLINNTIGTFIGYGIFSLSRKIRADKSGLLFKKGWLLNLTPAISVCAAMFLIDVYREFILLKFA